MDKRKISVAGAHAVSMAAAIASALGSMGFMGSRVQTSERKPRRPVPMMVTSPPEEIAAWNKRIEQLRPLRVSKLHRKPRGDTGQRPKFAKERQHRPASHPLRDGHGAYTLVGRGEMPNGITDGRRIWLGGISAQRGY
jgi:hypothetical protein